MATLRSFGGRSLTTRSPMMIRPSLISSSPATMRMAVDLPQPDGPTRTRNSSSSTSRLRLLTAGSPPPPYTLVTLSKITRDMEYSLHRCTVTARFRSFRPDDPEAPYDHERPARDDHHRRL